MKRTSYPRGLWSTLKGESLLAVNYFRWKVGFYAEVVKGHDGKTAEEVERERKIQEHLKSEQEKAPADETKVAPRQSIWAAMAATFGPKAGIAAIIDHCTKHHAAAIAVELNIDVKSVQVQTARSSVGDGTKVVGYIDAPMATEEEVHVFAERLTKSCPAARTYGEVEWRKR